MAGDATNRFRSINVANVDMAAAIRPGGAVDATGGVRLTGEGTGATIGDFEPRLDASFRPLLGGFCERLALPHGDDPGSAPSRVEVARDERRDRQAGAEQLDGVRPVAADDLDRERRHGNEVPEEDGVLRAEDADR